MRLRRPWPAWQSAKPSITQGQDQFGAGLTPAPFALVSGDVGYDDLHVVRQDDSILSGDFLNGVLNTPQ